MQNNLDKKDIFLEKVQKIWGCNADFVLDRLVPKKYFSLRINTLKSSVDYVIPELNKIGIDVILGPLPNTLLISADKKDTVTHSTLANEGAIYTQSLSSMLPALEIWEDYKRTRTPGESVNVLDLCVAPGGKSSMVAALLGNRVCITGVDNNISRINSAKRVFELLGVKNYQLVKNNASAIAGNPEYVGKYDYVLADVPCSNEGLIRDPSSYDFSRWNPKLAKKLSMLQKRILASGINALKPGGKLVYSTCTYSPEENELVIDWALKKFSEIKPEESIVENSKINVRIQQGLTEWRNHKLNPSVKNLVRILPDDYFDGFALFNIRKAS